MRVGVFGGSFNPVHYGHLLIAESCREQCKLDQIWFMPAAIPPHKQGDDLASAAQRVEMLQLAIAGNDPFRVSTTEIDRGGISFTVDTLATLHEQNPDTEWFLLMGADSLQELITWREPERICQLAIPVAVRRAGSPEPNLDILEHAVDANRMEQIRQHQVEMPIVDFSSTHIRERTKTHRSIRFRTPRAVEKYIETQGLYLAEE